MGSKMTQWINPLDIYIPQLRADYANHLFWGGISFLIPFFILYYMGVHYADYIALLVAYSASIGKKVVDYFKEFETVQMCVTKGLVTPFYGIVCVIMLHLK